MSDKCQMTKALADIRVILNENRCNDPRADGAEYTWIIEIEESLDRIVRNRNDTYFPSATVLDPLKVSKAIANIKEIINDMHTR